MVRFLSKLIVEPIEIIDINICIYYFNILIILNNINVFPIYAGTTKNGRSEDVLCRENGLEEVGE